MFSGLYGRIREEAKRRARRAEAQAKVARAVSATFEALELRQMMSYSPAVTYAAGTSPVSMTSGDFNNDGYADVVSANSGTNTVNVLLGNGDGTFGAVQSSTLGASPTSSYTGSQAGIITIGDFNADGKRDVAVVSGNNGVILMGNGDGTFVAPITWYLGNSPSRISTADVNADGKDDLLTANTAGTVGVSLSNGDGTFNTTNYAAGPDAQDVKALDLNHDGNLDLAVANAQSAGTVSVLLGKGDGTFGAYKSYYAFSAPFRMNVDDYNGDGNDDVSVANSYTSSYVTILYGDGNGGFSGYHSYDSGSQPWELESEDVDGDGKDDLISSNGSSYQIQMNNGDGTFAPATSIPGAGLVFAADDFNHDGTADLAGASGGNVGVMINQQSAQTNVSTAVGFAISAPPMTAAGAAMPITISAVDADGNVVSDFLGTAHITSTDKRMQAQTFTFTANDAGAHTFTSGVALFTLGDQTITATGPAQLTGSATISVGAAAATNFSIAADPTATAGSPMSFTVTARDQFGNLSTNYTGAVHFTSSDAKAILPADYTFTANDGGVHTFTATLKTAGNKVITATDTSAVNFRGTSAGTTVLAADAVSLGMVGGGGHIGSPKVVTITAYDAYGNVATGFSGTMHLSASDANMVLPLDGSLANGVGQLLVTPMTLGAQTLSVTDVSTGLSATENIVGTPGDAVKFVVTPISDAVAGTAQNVTVTAYDAFGNVAVDYGGTVAFTSSDRTLLQYYSFAAADNGTHTFSVVLKTAGTQTLTVQDVSNPSITSTQGSIVITPAAASTLSVTPLRDSVAGVTQNFTVTARDVYGNVATTYAGTLAISSSDTKAALPASYTFTAADAGTHTFSMTFKGAGGQTFTVQDTAAAAMSYFQNDINIAPAAAAGFSFKSPTNVTAGVAFQMTLSAVDAFGNTVNGYIGTVHFTGPSGSILPTDYTFTSADQGSHTFTFTISATGTQTISVQDLLKNKGSTQVNVKTSSGGSTSTGGGGGGGGGGGKKTL